MKILWLVDFPLPALANELGLPVQASGSWVTALLDALTAVPDALPQLTICCFGRQIKEPVRLEAERVLYRGLPYENGKAALKVILEEEKPDLVQLFGTEAEQALWLFELFDPRKILVYIQGLAGPCGEHMADGLPPRFLRRQPIKELLAKRTGGLTVLQQQQLLLKRGEREKALLRKACHVLGRTDWDRHYCEKVSPEIAYYPLNEIMRPDFYNGGWNRQNCQPHRLFVSQGNLPLKGLHRVICALPSLCELWPDTQLYVAGWPPPDKGPLLRPVMHWLAEYSGYLEDLVQELGIADHLHYTGVLDQAAMREQLLLAETFLMPSSIENSPNSLAEAMLTGVPSIAAAVGGIPSMMSSNEGALYNPDEPCALSRALIWQWEHPQSVDLKARRARSRALADHDPDRIASRQLEIYKQLSER